MSAGEQHDDGNGVRTTLASPDDVEAIQALEIEAGAPFAEIGLESIADADPPPAAELSAAIADGCVETVRDDSGLLGFIWWSVVDGETHIEQVSVHPRAAGRRLGRELIDRVCQAAARRGHHAVTLTTFRDVEWNGPLYQRYGFDVLEAAEMGAELAKRRREEAESGLDIVPRVAMRRVL